MTRDEDFMRRSPACTKPPNHKQLLDEGGFAYTSGPTMRWSQVWMARPGSPVLSAYCFLPGIERLATERGQLFEVLQQFGKLFRV